MQMLTGCPTINAQCRGGAALPSFRAAQVTISHGVVAAAGSSSSRQASMAAGCSNNSSLRMSAADTASDSSNAAAVVISCVGSATAGGPAAVGGGNRREKIEKAKTSCRAAVQESSISTVLEHAASKNGSSLLTDRSSDLHHSSDYIGFGCVLEGGSFFRERFVIRFSEAGHRGTISLETLSSLLQEAATNHVIAMDYAFTPGKNLDGNITVITRMHIEVDRYPAWVINKAEYEKPGRISYFYWKRGLQSCRRDLLEIDTWFQREGKNAVRRDWIVKDVKTGQNIAFATSTWVLMNTHTRRLSKLTEEQWAELEPHMRNPPRWALSEDRREVSTTKILKLGDDATYKKSGLIASDKDTDMNQHVNNIRYMSWMLESIPEEVKSTHEVSKITLEYRQEASQGEPVQSVAEAEESESSTGRRFTHLIKTSKVGKEINRGRTVWRSFQ